MDRTESKGFWLGAMNDLKSRGTRDIFILSVDGIAGIEDAIRATYPKTAVQRCIVHQIRNSLKYVSWKERKELASDLKLVYGASTLEEAEYQMGRFEERWIGRYPHVIKSWRTNWGRLTTFFDYLRAALHPLRGQAVMGNQLTQIGRQSRETRITEQQTAIG